MPIFVADLGRSKVAIYNARSEAEAAAIAIEAWFRRILQGPETDSNTSQKLDAAPLIRLADESEMSRWWLLQHKSGAHHLGRGGDVVVVVYRAGK